MPIKQGHVAIVERGRGFEGATLILYKTKKPRLTRVQLRRIRVNEPGKRFDPDYIRRLKFSYIQKDKTIPPIEVVRVPIQNGTWFLLVDGHHRFTAARAARHIYLNVIELHLTDVVYDHLDDWGK